MLKFYLHLQCLKYPRNVCGKSSLFLVFLYHSVGAWAVAFVRQAIERLVQVYLRSILFEPFHELPTTKIPKFGPGYRISGWCISLVLAL